MVAGVVIDFWWWWHTHTNILIIMWSWVIHCIPSFRGDRIEGPLFGLIVSFVHCLHALSSLSLRCVNNYQGFCDFCAQWEHTKMEACAPSFLFLLHHSVFSYQLLLAIIFLLFLKVNSFDHYIVFHFISWYLWKNNLHTISQYVRIT